MRVFTPIFTAAALACALPVAVTADELSAPTGPVILEVRGKIANTNQGDSAVFDLEMLEALASRTTTTATPWYDQTHAFSGPLGVALLEAVGATGDMLEVRALNDYATDIPVSDFTDYPVILAVTRDDELMSVREKGPIFVIYPFDEEPSLNNETYYGRSAWQVKSIDVR